MPQNHLSRSITFIIIGLFLAWAVIAAADNLTPLEVAEKLQRKYETTTSLSADFQQTASLEMSRKKRRGSGTLVIKKPGFMRWDYQAPDRQVIICDGKNILMFFEKSKQMMTGDASEYLKSDVTYSFLTGAGNFIKDFDVLEPSDQAIASADSYLIKLVPRKPHPQIAYLNVSVKKDSFLINHIQIVDQLDTVTDLFFLNIKLNDEIPADFFIFSPPSGTEVIHQ